MSTSDDSSPSGHRDDQRLSDAPELEQEVRLAVVLYGGVSLAVYIFGVARELLELVRATAPGAGGPHSGSAPNDAERLVLSTSAQVYRALAQRLGFEGRWAAPAARGVRSRFVVDVLSGTSAGGLNALFLGRALTTGGDLDGLESLWLDQADLDSLLNDALAHPDTRMFVEPAVVKAAQPSKKAPPSLLNSARMYFLLRNALGRITGDRPLQPSTDVSLTATEIRGRRVPVPTTLAGERIYRHHFRFKHDDQGQGDESEVGNPFLHTDQLAFAGRCTSAFPYAFEPLSMKETMDALKVPAKERAAWMAVLGERASTAPDSTPTTLEERARSPFNDGGVLDNKPLGAALDAIAQRRGHCPVTRKLLYVEPDPEVARPQGAPEATDFVDSLWTVVSLARVENIRDDLLRIEDRNRRIREAQAATRQLAARTFRHVRDYGFLPQVTAGAYVSYHRLKVHALQVALASALVEAAWPQLMAPTQADGSSLLHDTRQRRLARAEEVVASFISDTEPHFGALALSQKQRKRSAPEDVHDPQYQEALAFEQGFAALFALDPSYRRRRATFCGRELHRVASLLIAHDDVALCESYGVAKDAAADLTEAQRTLLAGRLRSVGDALVDALPPATPREARYLEILHRWFFSQGRELSATFLAFLDGSPDITALEASRSLQPVFETLDEHVIPPLLKTNAVADAQLKLADLTSLSSRKERARPTNVKLERPLGLRALTGVAGAQEIAQLAEVLFYGFNLFDQVLYPITNDRGVDEWDPLDVVPVSPIGANALVPDRRARRHKLAGSTLGHFGGFLRDDWRWVDMTWGRLDAAELILKTFMPADATLTLDPNGPPLDRDAVVETVQRRILEEAQQKDRRQEKLRRPDGRGVAQQALAAPDLESFARVFQAPVDWLADLDRARAGSLAARVVAVTGDMLEAVSIRRGEVFNRAGATLTRIAGWAFFLAQLLVANGPVGRAVRRLGLFASLVGVAMIGVGTFTALPAVTLTGAGVAVLGVGVDGVQRALTSGRPVRVLRAVAAIVLGAVFVMGLVTGKQCVEALLTGQGQCALIGADTSSKASTSTGANAGR